MNLKQLLFLFVIVQTHVLLAGSEPAQGYTILKNGDTNRVTIEVATSLIGDDIAWMAMQGKVKYTDRLNKKGKITPAEFTEFGFTYKNKKYRYLAAPMSWVDMIISGDIFMRLDQDGYCKVYSYFQRNDKTNSVEATPVLQKGSGETCLVMPRLANKLMSAMYGKGVKDYMADCPQLIKKIDDGGLKITDATNIANEYNQNCQH